MKSLIKLNSAIIILLVFALNAQATDPSVEFKEQDGPPDQNQVSNNIIPANGTNILDNFMQQIKAALPLIANKISAKQNDDEHKPN